jgi:LSD1 subclass zinc finger protein
MNHRTFAVVLHQRVGWYKCPGLRDGMFTMRFLQGAANVRCSQCQHVTPVTSAPATAPPTSTPPTSAPSGASIQQQAQAPRAQLQCAGCQIMLMYPRGAANVQCAVCGVVSSAAQVWCACTAYCYCCQVALCKLLQVSMHFSCIDCMKEDKIL